MNEAEFESILRGRERRFIEFKAACPVDTKDPLFLRAMKAIMGLANIADGGALFVGVEDGEPPRPVGVPATLLGGWTYEHVADCLKNYADPSVDFALTHFSYKGVVMVEIRVNEFAEVPILCKKARPAAL